MHCARGTIYSVYACLCVCNTTIKWKITQFSIIHDEFFFFSLSLCPLFRYSCRKTSSRDNSTNGKAENFKHIKKNSIKKWLSCMKKKIWRKNAPNWNNMSNGKGWRRCNGNVICIWIMLTGHSVLCFIFYVWMFSVVQGIRICRQKWEANNKKKNEMKDGKQTSTMFKVEPKLWFKDHPRGRNGY